MKIAEGLGDYRPQVAEYYDFVADFPIDAPDEQIAAYPGYMHRSERCVVFELGNEHVVRLSGSLWSDSHYGPNDPPREAYPDEALMRRITALDRAIGARGLEQLVAYDTTMPAVVTERIRDHVPYGDSQHSQPFFTADDYHGLFDTFEQIEARGLEYDPAASNTLYVPGKGFAIIDYDISQGGCSTALQCISEFAGDDILDPWHNENNARLYYLTAGERYGFTVTDEITKQWEGIGFKL